MIKTWYGTFEKLSTVDSRLKEIEQINLENLNSKLRVVNTSGILTISANQDSNSIIKPDICVEFSSTNIKFSIEELIKEIASLRKAHSKLEEKALAMILSIHFRHIRIRMQKQYPKFALNALRKSSKLSTKTLYQPKEFD